MTRKKIFDSRGGGNQTKMIMDVEESYPLRSKQPNRVHSQQVAKQQSSTEMIGSATQTPLPRNAKELENSNHQVPEDTVETQEVLQRQGHEEEHSSQEQESNEGDRSHEPQTQKLSKSLDGSSINSNNNKRKTKRRVARWTPKSSKKTKRNNSGNTLTMVAKDGGDIYYEAEHILDRRQKGKTVEFLVQWKGAGVEPSWEPEENLCDTLWLDAMILSVRENEEILGIKTVGVDNSDDDDDDDDELHRKEEVAGTPSKSSLGEGKEGHLLKSTPETQRTQDQQEQTDDINEGGATPAQVPVMAVQFANHQYPSSSAAFPAFLSTAAVVGPKPSDWTFWTDAAQIQYQPIERIHVQDPHARARVTACRRNGIPICLIGHKGWAQFAKRWLKPSSGGKSLVTPSPVTTTTRRKKGAKESMTTHSDNSQTSQDDENLLDLSLPHELDVQAMQDDVGMESVPVVRLRYNETDPIHRHISLRSFLQRCWPDIPTSTPKDRRKTASTSPSNSNNNSKVSLYLHQWQFPLSETAVVKLCGPGKNIPLPNYILGDDFLRYYLESDRCKRDSPYQYIFMGNAGTMSKLHKDNGGLLITIAPIIGEKEVVLVHRDDGQNCLYQLNANLDKPDLHNFPLMYDTRVFKSIIRPGEILIMPQGTYHQCRNISPCLSYSRFILDKEDLRPFLQSMFQCDACEIDHEDILWNAGVEIIDRVDCFVEGYRSGSSQSNSVPEHVLHDVETLVALRNISREIARSDEVKKKFSEPWHKMVTDIDHCLHYYRYRASRKIPGFQPKKSKVGDVALDSSDDKQTKASTAPAEATAKLTPLRSQSTPEIVSRPLHLALMNTVPMTKLEEEGFVIDDDVALRNGDIVRARLMGKFAVGEIRHIETKLKAAFVEYEELAPSFSEYIPFDLLKVPTPGGPHMDIGGLRSLLPPGSHVIVVEEDDREEYHATLKSWRLGTFYHVMFRVANHLISKWLCRESIVELIADASPPSDNQQSESSPNAFISDGIVSAKATNPGRAKNVLDLEIVDFSPHGTIQRLEGVVASNAEEDDDDDDDPQRMEPIDLTMSDGEESNGEDSAQKNVTAAQQVKNEPTPELAASAHLQECVSSAAATAAGSRNDPYNVEMEKEPDEMQQVRNSDDSTVSRETCNLDAKGATKSNDPMEPSDENRGEMADMVDLTADDEIGGSRPLSDDESQEDG